MIALDFSFPVSLDVAYSNKGRSRVNSPEHKAWLVDAEACFLQQRLSVKPFKGPYSLSFSMFEKDNRRRDPDNFVKLVSDFVVKKGLVEDDSFCSDFQVLRLTSSSDFNWVRAVFMPSPAIRQQSKITSSVRGLDGPSLTQYRKVKAQAAKLKKLRK